MRARQRFRSRPHALSSRVVLNKFSPPPTSMGERRGAGAKPFAPAPLGLTDVTDFVRLARQLSVPTDDAIRLFVDRDVRRVLYVPPERAGAVSASAASVPSMTS